MNCLRPDASSGRLRTLPTPIFWLIALVAGTGIGLTQAVPAPERADPARQLAEPAVPAKNRDQGKPRVREGTELANQPGSFRLTGDRVTFSTKDDDRRFVCLENLNLERVVRAMAEDPTRLPWTVSGRVTEYQGANYVLIERATLNSGVKEE